MLGVTKYDNFSNDEYEQLNKFIALVKRAKKSLTTL